MLLARQRELLVRYARRLGADGLAVGTAGNLSVRAGDLVAVTPSAVDYEQLLPELVPVIGLDGARVEGELPSSTETPMHLALYRAGRAGAVVHTHSPYATTLATLGLGIPAIHYLVGELGGPVRVAPYARPGSEELGRAVAGALEGRSAALLESHGAIAVADSLEHAYTNALTLEWLAALAFRARLLGEPRPLPDDEVDALVELMRRYRGR